MRDYSNVQLLSCQGTKFELNSAQLASASKFLHKLLHENFFLQIYQRKLSLKTTNWRLSKSCSWR